MRTPAQQAGADKVAQLINRFGCLPEAPDGPTLPKFQAKALGKAINHEIARAKEYGWSKITLHMDLPDAHLLAQYLLK
jgi:hypothetical protein